MDPYRYGGYGGYGYGGYGYGGYPQEEIRREEVIVRDEEIFRGGYGGGFVADRVNEVFILTFI